MTFKTIEKLINDREKEFKKLNIIPISTCDNVEYVKVWYNMGYEYQIEMTADFIYYIKNEKGEYVGAVQHMSNGDMLWFVKKEHSGKHYVTDALSKYIIPHICSRTSGDLVCTLGTDDGKAVGKKLGFEINDDIGKYDRNKANPCPDFILSKTHLEKQYKHLLKNGIDDIINRLKILDDHLSYADQDDEAFELREAENYLRNIVEIWTGPTNSFL
ncbi:MAG: hypothetical protein NTX65_16570 [Ignavibacteriales bacterium]|nr:hypothetical protein [Ignavibacteriales bacterium]